MFEKIKGVICNALGLAPKKGITELLISVEKIETRFALLENGRLEEFQIEREGDRSIAGSIYKGRVKNIEPGLKAMFVDIGVEKNAFLHYWDALPAALDEIETIDRGQKKSGQKKITADDIPELYPVGSEVVVQVTKGPIGTKGARVTTNISLAGRFIVLTPYSDQFGISRKISDPAERSRLRKILANLDVPESMGIIIRTVGEGQKARYFVRDLAILLEQWAGIQKAIEERPAPAAMYEEAGIVDRSIRDFLTEEVDRIIIDDAEAFERAKMLVGQVSKRSIRKIRHYTDPVPLFERFGIDRQLDSAFRRQVFLKSGAYLVIDETEALVAIDVNSGRNKGTAEQDDTLVATNLEAADEIARQLRLRNIGGLVIIDYIDMKARRDQNLVMQRFRQALHRDKAKTHVLPISSLGLVEMTRQRTEESVTQTVYHDCPYCKGRGMVKTPETMSLELQRELGRVLRLHPDVHEVRIITHPLVLERLRSEDDDALVELERKHASRLYFRADPKIHIEEFGILDATTEKELK